MVKKLEGIEKTPLAFPPRNAFSTVSLAIRIRSSNTVITERGQKMVWARLLAYATGAINRELLLKNEYLVAENRILKTKVKARLVLFEGEKATLAEIAHRLGRKALEEVAATAQPDTIWAGIGNSSPGSSMGRSSGSEQAGRRSIRT